MKLTRIALCCAIALAACVAVSAEGPKLDGAYKFVSEKYPGGQSTEAEVKGMLVVHGHHMAFVRASTDRAAWGQGDSAEDRAKKVVAAFQGLAATCGEFKIQNNMIVLQQLAQASPSSMGKEARWQYTIDGKWLKLKPAGNADVEFTFERLPD